MPAARPLTLLLTLPVWNGHSCPLPLTLISTSILILSATAILTERVSSQMWVPHLSRLLRKVGITDARSAAFDIDVNLAFDSDSRDGTNREGHDVKSCRKGDTTVEEQRFSTA
jgi:hypothetical protein